MKTDQYLNLCLEQAAHSTLRHRHGCIVVKGGKVIGQGFNDFRPGYDGGVLNTTPFASAAIDRAHSSDQSLSMHSEMMAIHSVLSSSASANTAKAKKRIVHDSKRNRGMRREAVESYADRVLAETFGPLLNRGLALPAVPEWGFEPRRCREVYHHHYPHKERKQSSRVPARRAEKIPSKGKDHTLTGGLEATSLSSKVRRQSNSYANAPPDNLTQSSKGKPPVHESIGAIDRWKHSKLHGADVYVARLSRCGTSACQHPGATKVPFPCKVDCGLPSATHVAGTTGSLFDELTSKPAPPPPPKRRPRRAAPEPGISAVESRPCYRCIFFMHSVGIRRVFWTDNDGLWQGSKVRDLVETLGQGALSPTTEDSSSLFVTKYEILRFHMSRQQAIPTTTKNRRLQ